MAVKGSQSGVVRNEYSKFSQQDVLGNVGINEDDFGVGQDLSYTNLTLKMYIQRPPDNLKVDGNS